MHERLDERRLADARFARDHDDAGAAVQRALELVVQRVELLFAADMFVDAAARRGPTVTDDRAVAMFESCKSSAIA